MNRTMSLLAACSLPLFLAGCLSDDDDDEVVQPEPEFANVRVIHAASDAPLVNITANDTDKKPQQNGNDPQRSGKAADNNSQSRPPRRRRVNPQAKRKAVEA